MNFKDFSDSQLPEFPLSYWRDSVCLPTFPQLEENLDVDVVIVGGGITGITSAYLLTNAGLKVALLEADQLVSGTTGHTTAKITAQHDIIYDELIQTMGKSKAKLYFEANLEALKWIKETVENCEIDCDFKTEDAYIYATTDETVKKLEKEWRAYQKIGINGELLDKMPLKIDIKKALVMRNQARFHPIHYLTTFVQTIQKNGGMIFEQTTAVTIEKNKKQEVITKNGKRVSAQHILICTHFPFYEGLGLYSGRMYADRSYVLCVKPKKEYPGGMYISADEPTRSIRSLCVSGEERVLIIGENHRTGEEFDTKKRYKALEAFGEQIFGIEEISHHWSAQDLTTLDKIPYIGELINNQPNIFVATAYKKWGMTSGTAAALLLKDKVLGKKNRYEDLFKPTRFYAHPSLKNFLLQNANVLFHLLKGKMDVPYQTLQDLENDEGAVISIRGHRKGAYKDKDGNIHIVDTTCTHVGCEVEWNNSERTWDCPCHGSRFSYTGEVVEGPAEKPLQQYDYKMIDNFTSPDSGY